MQSRSREVRVDVYRDGAYLKTIERRLREFNGSPAVRFRGVCYPIVDECEIHIDAPRDDAELAQPTRLDDEQRAIAEADPAERLIINAGPGTGKTRVACARVASLIRRGVEPSNIWIISFTRTAVSEVRNRIRILVSEEERASSVMVATLDSHAWYFREGFEGGRRSGAFSGFEENIERAIEVLRKNDVMVREYLESVEHVVIDEAQDLIGARAEMLELLIRRIPRTCGVSVFTDDAQAIYGFSETDKDCVEADLPARRATLPERLRADKSLGFASVELAKVYRTKSKRLQRLLTEARQLVLEPGDTAAKLHRLRIEIESSADSVLDELRPEEMLGRDDLLVLFRRRAEVLIASGWLWRAGVPHRIRMSGYPRMIHPWVGTLLRDCTDRYLTRSRFDELWASRIGSPDLSLPSSEQAWTLMWRTAGASADRIEMSRLRRRLSSAQVPLGFLSPEIGTGGPILGTIHASKGREAPYVDLMLPSAHTEHGDFEEEARILFVGATRAREGLRVGKAPWSQARSLDSGRVAESGSLNQKRKIRLEIGRDQDLEEALLVSTRVYASEADVEEAQSFLRSGVPDSFNVVAMQQPNLEFNYVLYADVGGRRIPLGGLTNLVKQDLWSLARRATARDGRSYAPPNTINYIRVIGVRSVVLPEDHPELIDAYPPYDETGIFLAPVLCSFPVAYLRATG